MEKEFLFSSGPSSSDPMAKDPPSTRTFLCHRCPSSYAHLVSLRLHLLLGHSDQDGTRLLQCQDCGQAFALLKGVAMHRRTVHGKGK